MLLYFVKKITSVFSLLLILTQIKLISLTNINGFTITDLSDSGSFIDFTDYKSLFFFVTTSKKIYKGITPEYKSSTDAKINKNSAGVSYDDNTILLACLDDSLLSHVNINTGTSKSILSYSELNINLKVPNYPCSLAFDTSSGVVYIAFSFTYDDEDPFIKNETLTINENKKLKNYVISFETTYDSFNSIIAKNKTEIKFYHFDYELNIYGKTIPQKQISCELVYVDYKRKLICGFLTFNETNNEKPYVVNLVSIKNDFSDIDQEPLIINSISNEEGFKIQMDDYNTYVRLLLPKLSFKVSLTKSDNNFIINVIGKDDDKNKYLYNFESIKDLFSFHGNHIFSCVYSSPTSNYLRIKSSLSDTVLQLFKYNEGIIINKITGYYKESSSLYLIFFQTDKTIKYFTLSYNGNLFYLQANSQTFELSSNYDSFTFDPKTLAQSSTTLDIFVFKLRLYKSINDIIYYSPEGCTYDYTNQILTVDSSENNWYYIKFAYQESVSYNDNFYLWVIIPDNFELYIKTCAFECGSCSTNFSICDSCRNDFFKLSNSNDNNCYYKEQNIPNYFYNNKTNIFEKCHSSCKFCNEAEDNTLNNHNCIYCEDNYFKSYEYMGNCYKKNIDTDSNIVINNKNDEEFSVVNSCSEAGKSYKINETNECVTQCPQNNVYVTVTENINVNLTGNGVDETIKYTFIEEKIPKYILGNVCYKECPNGTETDEINNLCKCKYAWHKNITNNEIICYEKEDYCIYDYYKYYLNDTKECIHEKCSNDYYIFNNKCYKNNCPENTKLKSDGVTCICNDYFINNNDNITCFESGKNCESEGYNITNLDNKECLNNIQECILKNYTIFNNNCYLNCPNNTKLIYGSNYCTCSYFYYYSNNKLICLDYDKTCEDEGLITNVDTNECFLNINDCILYKFFIYENKCYKKCPNNTYLKLGSNICLCSNYLYKTNQLKCADSDKICENNNYFIININNETCLNSIINCINNNDLSNEDCYEGCSNDMPNLSNINNYICLKLTSNETTNDNTNTTHNITDIDFIIVNKTVNETVSYIVENIIKKKDILSAEDIVLISDKTTYVVTLSNKYNKSANYSNIDLGDCENILKKKYNINKNLSLIMLEVNYFVGNNIGVQYEVYHPITKEKLDLSYCKNTKIIINAPIYLENYTVSLYNILSEQNYDLFNPNNSFYNDLCAVFTTENDTDILLSDRKQDYYNNSLELCEENCEYEKYDSENQKVQCSCDVKNGITDEKNIIFQINNLRESFFDFDSFSNIKIIKCYKVVFSADGLKKNIGSYILLIIIFIYIITTIIFIINGVIKLKGMLSVIFAIKKPFNPIKKSATNYVDIKKTKSQNVKNNELASSSKMSFLIIKKKGQLNKKKTLHENKKHNGIVKRKHTNMNIISNKKLISKAHKKYSSTVLSSHMTKKSKTHSKLNNIPKIQNDTELNRLQYEDAIKFDHRKYIEYYWSLLKTKHVLIFTFFHNKDYNLFVIKFNLFLFGFALYFCVNALFFTDDTMHEIYSQFGNYNFIFGILDIFYSSVISSITTIIIKQLSLTENSILKIKYKNKKTKNKKTIINEISQLIGCFKTKYFIFYSASFILLIFFWYFLAAFCAIYRNTQYILLKDTLTSYGLSLIYPFGIKLIPGIFRIPAIKNKKRKCCYQLGQLIALI